jgi:hypothetical protein
VNDHPAVTNVCGLRSCHGVAGSFVTVGRSITNKILLVFLTLSVLANVLEGVSKAVNGSVFVARTAAVGLTLI